MAASDESQSRKDLSDGVQPSVASWFAEIKRRRVFRALVGYGLAAFAVLQIIEPIMHGLHWPESVLSYVVAALAAGFPVVTALAWVFDVKAGRIERTPSATATRGRRGVLALLLVGIALLAAAPGIFYYFILRSTERSASNAPRSSGAANKLNSVVVLPFVNANGNADAEYLADGITEALINSLSQIRELQVIARTTAFHYKGKEVNFQKTAHELSVDAALTGTLRQVGNTLVIQADLINLATGTQLWGDRYSRKVTDVLSVQEDITQAILEKIRPRLSAEEQRRATKHYTDSPEAYQLYLRGRYLWNQRGKDNITQAIGYFQRAIDMEPNFALAHTGLADSYALLGSTEYGGARDALPKAETAARTALRLDDNLAEAHTSLGYIAWHKWDWGNAEREYKRAIALKPNYSTAHHWYGIYLRSIGRWQEALAQLNRAHELDPLFPPMVRVSVLYEMGSYDRAIAILKDWLEMYPEDPSAHALLADCYLKQDMYQEAISKSREALTFSGGYAYFQVRTARIYAQAGDKTQALKMLADLRRRGDQIDPEWIAYVYAALDDKDLAFEWLEKAYQRRSDMLLLLKSAAYEPLRTDPRYANLIRRIGFPE